MRKLVAAALCVAFLSGCTANTTVPASGAGAGVVMPARVIESPTSVYIPPDLSVMSQKIPVTGYQCSAWSFPTSIGPAIAETIRLTNRAALKHEIPGGTAMGPPQGADYNIAFAVEAFEARVTYAPSFFSAVISSTAEITLQVRVVSPTKGEVVRTVIYGQGASTLEVVVLMDRTPFQMQSGKRFGMLQRTTSIAS
jgi:hypothetical protein